MPYEMASHYLAFMLAYFQDEGVLPDNHEVLTDALVNVRRSLTDVLPKQGVDLDRLDPGSYDAESLRREFHAGGPLSDPDAGPGLLGAIRVLRENFGRLDDGGALIIEF